MKIGDETFHSHSFIFLHRKVLPRSNDYDFLPNFAVSSYYSFLLNERNNRESAWFCVYYEEEER